MTTLTPSPAARPATESNKAFSRSTAGQVLKAVAQVTGILLALPYLIGFVLLRPWLGRVQAFSAASEHIARLPAPMGIYTRQAFYRRMLRGRLGRDVYLGFMTVLSKAGASMGDQVYIGRFCNIGWAHIGERAIVADHVQILSGRHQHGRKACGPWRDNGQQFEAVSIGAGAWIGTGAIVMADVGENAVVGAGAVVVKPVAANTKVVGNPARVIE